MEELDFRKLVGRNLVKVEEYGELCMVRILVFGCEKIGVWVVRKVIGRFGRKGFDSVFFLRGLFWLLWELGMVESNRFVVWIFR